MTRIATLLACTMLATPGWALVVPVPDKPTEPRVVHAPYSPNDIIQIIAPSAGSVALILSPEETTFDVHIGAGGWSHGSAGHSIVLSAAPGAPTTNGYIVSYLANGTTRRYALELTAAAEGVKPTNLNLVGIRVASNDPASGGTGSFPMQIPYVSVRMTYGPQDVAQARPARPLVQQTATSSVMQTEPATIASRRQDGRARAAMAEDAARTRSRCNFMWRGDPSVVPVTACDDGATTTFYWPGQLPVAAVFLVNPDGTEQSVTQAAAPDRPGLMVVPATSQFWRLRRGETVVADLYNASWDPVGTVTGTNTFSPRVRTRVRAPGARQ